MPQAKTRPFGIIAAIAYAWRAGLAHYRFARRHHDTDVDVHLVVSRRPTQDRMDDAGCRWSDWSRMQAAQPVDPAVIWSDVSALWAAYHHAKQRPVLEPR